MKWRGRRTSRNIEDRRGGFQRMGGRGRMRGGGAKIGGLGAVAIVVLGLVFGVDTSFLLGGGQGFNVPVQRQTTPGADDRAKEFVGVVLADTEDVWAEIFAEAGQRYPAPGLVLFSGRTASACGSASAASGPFYCPADRKAYLDTDFFRVMQSQLGAGGDFAAAYVIAHEVAHHVQNIMGILPEVNRRRAAVSKVQSNRLSVMVELQADCFAGVWARRAQERFGTLEAGDIEEAINAASQIGDDILQRNAGRAVVPDSFQHGTSAQRVRWFSIGLQSGSLNRCDTFTADQL